MSDAVTNFIKIMDEMKETLSQDVVDDPEELFGPMVELTDLWAEVRGVLETSR